MGGQRLGIVFLGALIFTIVITTTGALELRTDALTTAPDNAGRRDVGAAHERLLRGFEEQRDAEGRTQFVSRNPESTVVLSGDAAMLVLGDTALHMRLVGATSSAQADPSDELGGKSHYFIGNDPAKWRTNQRTFAKVRFREVYRGVDLVYYGRGQKLEYDFVVAPGAHADRIHLRFDGADRVTLDDDGGLRLRMGAGDILMEPPHLYQEAAGGRRTIPGRYVLEGSRDVRFEVGAYDHGDRLIIDPVVTYSTYFGGRGNDASQAVAVDSQGFIYLTGRTGNVDVNDFPTVNALQPDFHAFHTAFITKLTPDGSAVVYSTYFGGSFADEGRGIAVDRHARVYVVGTTNSEDFPLVNPVQTTCGGFSDAFVAKLNASGSALEYSTCLGGQSNAEEGFGIALDDDGNAYVTGYTRSSEFPTKHALQRRHAGQRGEYDAFLSVIRPEGSDFVYSTFLGGTSADEGRGIALDDERNVYLTGRTRSTDFPVRNAFQAALRGETDAFVTKIDRKGQQIVYSTYLGGEVGLSDDGIPLSRGGDELGLAIAVDAGGNATVTGRTNSTDLPTLNAAQAQLGGPQHPSLGNFTTDAFVARFDATGVASYVTYAGGNSNDEPTAIALDAKGVAWITGTTESADFPSVRARQPIFGDALVFSSPDAGATWQRAAGAVGHRNVLAVAVDPTDPAVIYAGTFGGGVFKTIDGGGTWAAMNTGLANLFVDSLVLDPVHPSRLFAGTDGAGVFRSLDGGATWTLSFGPAPVAAMAIAPTNPAMVYAGVAARGVGGVFSTTDGGDTWRRGGTDLVRGLTVDPLTPSTVYAGTNAGLFKSTDAGLTFEFHKVGNSFNAVNALAVDPSLTSTVYAGTDGAVTTSTDGGVTWVFRSSGVIGTVHALAIQASSPSTLYAGTSNGVFKTTDGGNTWTATSAGLTSPFVNALAINPGNPSQLYAGSLGTTDTFVMAFRPNGTIRYSSFLGGNGEELGGGIAIGRRQQIYVSGGTASSDFLTVHPVQPTYGGFGDAFVTVLSRTRRRQHP
jgi:photosystem II stability/assembly factor-like uncharacterized protein